MRIGSDKIATVGTELCEGGIEARKSGMSCTHFAGTVCSSMGPLSSVAMLLAAVFASSCPFEIERVFISSSSTPTDLFVSFAEVAGVASITSTAGISVEFGFER